MISILTIQFRYFTFGAYNIYTVNIRHAIKKKGDNMHQKISFIDQTYIGKKSIFYVGGKFSGTPGKSYVCNQMYVEAYEPKEILHPYPIVFFHGAGQTNVNWMVTPDGRMGWADYFVSKGYCVYMAEQPSRGRSAYHPEVNGERIYHSVESLINRFTSNQGTWPQAKLHTQWPDNGSDWNDETLRQFLDSQVEYLPSNQKSQELVLQAGKELLQLIGPVVLLTHSQAGPFGWLLADACPEAIKGIVALEPSGPPFSTDLSVNQARNYGISDLPLQYDPPIQRPEDIKLTLLSSLKEGIYDGWIFDEPAPKLPKLQEIPILLLTSEASYHAGYDHLTSYVMNQSGIKHDFVRLNDVGICGNGHMMMLEKNNLEIADWIMGWLKKMEIN